jgi:hypothetical protein
MARTVEEIAREASERHAAKAFGVEKWRDSTYLRMVHGASYGVEDGKEKAEDWLACRRAETVDYLLPIITAAIEEALHSVPVPGPVSEERLAEIRAKHKLYTDREPSILRGSHVDGFLSDQQQHIDHLTRILQDCAADGLTGAYKAGHVAGWKEAMIAYVEEEAKIYGRNPQYSHILSHPSEE